MAIEDTYSPMIHRLNQAIRRRAVEPEVPVGLPAEILMKYSKPPQELVEKSASELNRLIEVAKVLKGIYIQGANFLHV
jgi:ATP-dependent DNA helicase 2 subunit 2